MLKRQYLLTIMQLYDQSQRREFVWADGVLIILIIIIIIIIIIIKYLYSANPLFVHGALH